MPRRPVDFRLYLVTDRRLFSDEAAFLRALEAAVEGGVRAVQLREKDLPIREVLRLARALRGITGRHGARLFINDRADIAASVDADGVHLSLSGLPAGAARTVIGKDRLIGVSAHTMMESVAAAEEGADFITLGPVFDTPSKRKYGHPVGTAFLRRVAEALPLPVFAIGGVKEENLREVLAAGAAGAALITGILAEKDVKGSAEKYLRTLGV